jgi:hypothetical protein
MAAAQQLEWRPDLLYTRPVDRDEPAEPVEFFWSRLKKSRDYMTRGLLRRDDDWLDQLPVRSQQSTLTNFLWVFHTVEYEAHHRGLIRWFRSRMPPGL